MRSSSFLITLLTCATSSQASPNPNPNQFASLSHRHRHPTFLQIPRGGASSDDSTNKNGMDMKSLLDSMGGGMPGMPDLSAPPSPEQLQQSMAQFQSLLASPQFQSILNDPSKMEEQLENARQNLLKLLSDLESGEGELGGNPMMKMMVEQMKGQLGEVYPGGWDGLKELIENEERWKETMSGFVEVIKNMGEEDWSSVMASMGGMGGMGGGMPGMPGMGGFPGGSTLGDTLGGDSGTLAGLDELSEGED